MRVDRGALEFRAAQRCCPRPQQELIDVVSGDVAGEPDVLKTRVTELRVWCERKWVRIMRRYQVWHRVDGHRLGSTTPECYRRRPGRSHGDEAGNHDVTR
jgi:hypothetical protein